jgi:ankyrin repeat protein
MSWDGHLTCFGFAGGGRGVELVMELVQAVRNGNVSEVRRQAVLGVDVNVEGAGGVRPLHYAANNGNMEAMRALAEMGADVHAAAADGKRPVHVAALNGDVET